MAGAVVLDAAVETAKDCIQILGGIGFTWEHDAHLYLRRAVALRALAGGSALWQRRVTELSRAGARRVLRVDLGERESERASIRERVEAIAALPADERRVATGRVPASSPRTGRRRTVSAPARPNRC